MYRELGLADTHLGMILLYTAVNISLAVWLLKGFVDEIPREYEEAAMIDGYSRFQSFRKVVLPQATTGIAATAIFCLIFSWNEYAFALLLTSGTAQTTWNHFRRCPQIKRSLMSENTTMSLRRYFCRNFWEWIATVIILLGVVMLMQPFLLVLYTYSFVVILTGTVLFIIVSHFPD